MALTVELRWSAHKIEYQAFRDGQLDREAGILLAGTAGIYLWRYKRGWLSSIVSLYVGQTRDSFWRRFSAHVRADLGDRLDVLVDEGQSPYVLVAELSGGNSTKKGRVTQKQFDCAERALIWELNPLWNKAQRFDFHIPDNIVLVNSGDVPSGVKSRIQLEGRHLLSR